MSFSCVLRAYEFHRNGISMRQTFQRGNKNGILFKAWNVIIAELIGNLFPVWRREDTVHH
jgi:hypothetical protein